MRTLIEGWTFDSDFDSGNLMRVEVGTESNVRSASHGSKIDIPGIALSAEINRSSIQSRSSVARPQSSRPKTVKTCFHLWTRADGAGVVKPTKNRTWFHFSIEKVSALDQVTTISFKIMNLNSVKRLFDLGMRPFYRCGTTDTWRRIPTPPMTEVIDSGIQITFEFTMHPDSHLVYKDQHEMVDIGTRVKPAPFGKYYFAYALPYTYTQLQTKLNHLENIYSVATITKTDFKPIPIGSKKASGLASRIPRLQSSPSLTRIPSTSSIKSNSSSRIINKSGKASHIYFHRELLTQSLDKNRIDLITISSTDDMSENLESTHEDFFPDGASNRCRAFNMSSSLTSDPKLRKADEEGRKKFFIITARVHPGETVASFILDGILDFLLCEHDPRAISLRSKYVFKIIPMLNPDGCIRGHYREDSRGINLNRVYDFPDKQFHPSIYATKKYIVDICGAYGEIGFYIDLHGHANKPGCFLFANRMTHSQSRTEIWNYGKKLKEHCPWFDLRECDFTCIPKSNLKSSPIKETNSVFINKDGMQINRTKDGTGRVAIFNATKCIHSYTFEANYFSARHNIGWTGPLKHSAGYPFGVYCPPAVKCTNQECPLGKSIANFIQQLYPLPSKSPFLMTSRLGFTIGDLHSMGRSIALAALDVNRDGHKESS